MLEAKPTISKQYLEYAGDKAASVRRLERTSVPIRHAGGEYPPKVPFPILAGIVAASAEWADGCARPGFLQAISGLTNERSLDFGIALSDCAFNLSNGKLVLSPRQGSLAAFLFGLLDRLQSLGTVPAVDWNKYGAVFSGDV